MPRHAIAADRREHDAEHGLAGRCDVALAGTRGAQRCRVEGRAVLGELAVSARKGEERVVARLAGDRVLQPRFSLAQAAERESAAHVADAVDMLVERRRLDAEDFAQTGWGYSAEALLLGDAGRGIDHHVPVQTSAGHGEAWRGMRIIRVTC